MKHTSLKSFSIALCAASAFCGASSAVHAANVDVYGFLDLALRYEDRTGEGSSLTMAPNSESGSRIGLRSTEDLGNGNSVIMVLEAQIQPDTGSIQSFHGKSDDFFGRQAFLGWHSDQWGEVIFGRLYNGSGPAGRHQTLAFTDAFKCAWQDASTLGVAGQQNTQRLNNAIQYASPTMAGWKGVATFSLTKYDKTEETIFENNTKFYDLAITHKTKKSYFMVGANKTSLGNNKIESGWDAPTFSFVTGGNYDFGFIKTFAQFRYTKHSPFAGYSYGGTKDWKNMSVSLGVQYPLTARDRLMASVQYLDAESEAKGGGEFEKEIVAVGISHSFSKTTNIYLVGSYSTSNGVAKDVATENRAMVNAGIRHLF